MSSYNLKMSINGTPNKIRLFKERKDSSIFGDKKNLKEVLAYLKNVGRGKILVTDAAYDNVFYAEEAKGVYVNILFFTEEWLVNSNFKDSVEKSREYQRKSFDNKDFDAYFRHIPVPMRMYAFEKVYKWVPEDEVFDIWMEIYNGIDYNAAAISREVFEYVCEHVKRENSEEEVTIYRGEADKSQSYDKALSWTTNINTAIHFAIKDGVPKAVWEAKVKKCDIITYYDKRSEQEVIVLPEKVADVKQVQFHNCLEYYMNGLFFEPAEYCKSKADLLKGLYNSNEWHDLRHVVRVVYLTRCIARDLKMEPKDIELASICAVYHDCGRENEGIDPMHGKRSAAKFALLERFDLEDMVIAQKVIEHHCDDDEEGEKAIASESRIVDKDRALKIYRLIKDADALDRVRFRLGDDGLDYEMLRLPESKQHVLIAGFLFTKRFDEDKIEFE